MGWERPGREEEEGNSCLSMAVVRMVRTFYVDSSWNPNGERVECRRAVLFRMPSCALLQALNKREV